MRYQQTCPAVLLAAALTTLSFPAHADTGDGVPYIAAAGGVNNLKSWDASVDFGGPQAAARLALKRGATASLAWGKEYERSRYELEFQHGRIGITGATLASFNRSVDTSGSYNVLTANAVRTLRVGEQTSAYGLAGIGVARVSLPEVPVRAGCNCLADADKTGFTWQIRLGIEHKLSERGSGFVQLGWLNLPGPGTTGTPSASYENKGTASVTLGYRHRY